MKNDQFAVYRVNRNSEGRDLWHLSYQEAVSRKLAIRIEHYRQMDIRPLLPGGECNCFMETHERVL